MPEIVANNISIIETKELERFSRIDAEYYQPKYLTLQKLYKKGDWSPIGRHLKNCEYGISIAMNTEGKGYGILRMDNLQGGFAFDDDIKYAPIDRKVFTKYKLQKDDVLFNRVNSEEFVGRTGIYKLSGNHVFASYLVRLQTKESELLPDYLNIFLNTKYGILSIRRMSRRAVNQANVNAQELKAIKILLAPLKFQEEIKDLLEKSHGLFEQSKVLYSQAETLLLEELGIKDIDLSHEPCYEVNSVEAINSNRIDAEYFQPKYERIIEAVRNKCGMFTIKDIFDFRRGDFIDVKYYTEEKTARPFIRIKELSINSTINSDEVIYINDEYTNNKTTTLRTGDLVIAIIGDTIGKTNLILEEFEGGFCSNNTGVLRLKEFYKNRFDLFFLEKIFHSIFIQLQIEKRKAQTGQPKIADKEIKQIGIPLVDYQKQRAIGDLICQSHSARRQAKELLDEAKRKVEEMIEKGNQI